MLTKFIKYAVMFCLLNGCANASEGWRTIDNRNLSPEDIDGIIERLIMANDVKGLGVALIDEGEIQYMKGHGHRMVEKNLPLEPDTIIYGASLTKATFAYFVMQLVDEGQIDLDTSIAEYLPKPLPTYDGEDQYADLVGDDRWRDLTMRILLSHQTGFSNFRFFDASGDYDEDGELAFYFDPGTRYAYSGEGFLLAQHVIEAGLGLDVGVEMQTRIFDRFGMTKTSMTWREDFLENYSHNYSIEGENLRHNLRENVRASGSMDTTLADWSHFLAAVSRGEGLSETAKSEMISRHIRIKSKTQFPTLRKETTNAYDDIKLGYGLGWGTFETPYGKAFFKEGHDDGTANYAMCVEGPDKCILMMSNSVRAEGIFKEAVETLMGDVKLPWRWEGYIPYDLVGELDKVTE